MRGKAIDFSFGVVEDRITPAYAGKRICRRCTHAGMRDHPRLCGEKVPKVPLMLVNIGSPPPMRGKADASKVSMYAAEGSPPPMRGKDRHVKILGYVEGITPAYAGKSYDEGTATKDKVGITPAYAGKSTGGGLDGTFYKDHPRLCGEKHVFPAVAVLVLGSPPPMRGKATRTRTGTRNSRITPAYAGKRTAYINIFR